MSLRIVSLVPSSTETLLALGVPVTACTRFCEQPGIPHVGGTKNPDIGAIIELATRLRGDGPRGESSGGRRRAGGGRRRALRVGRDALSPTRRTIRGRPRRSRRSTPPPTSPPLPSAEATASATGVRADLAPSVDVDQRLTYGADLLTHLGLALVTDDHPDRYPTVDLDDIVPGDPAWCSCRASRTSSRDDTSTSCASVFGAGVPVVARSTAATCSGGAAARPALCPASAPNSTRDPCR